MVGIPYVAEIGATIYGVDVLADRFGQAGDAAADLLASDVAHEAAFLRSYIIGEKLSGQAVHGTDGMLEHSLHWALNRTGETISAILLTENPFAPVLEFGYSGPQHVPGHWRLQDEAFGHPVAPHQIWVNDFDRFVNIAAHAFFYPAVDEQTAAIQDHLSHAPGRMLDAAGFGQ